MRKVRFLLFLLILYFRNVLVAIDQLFNAILFGDPDETISSRLGKNRKKCSICNFICKFLDKIDKRHCSKSIEKDEGFRDIILLIRQRRF
jgi:hypothetical protein